MAIRKLNLLLFSDLHEDMAAAQRLVERSQGVDVVIGAGDFGNMRRGVERCIQALQAIRCPVALVPGNNESVEELITACRSWPNARILHGTGVTLEGRTFYGIGGGIPITPFGVWSYDFTEEQATALLTACPSRGVLISHSPPQGCVDVTSQGRHIGSVAVRETILRVRPALVVCGHVHGSAGKMATIGETPVINAGPNGVEWELPPVFTDNSL